MINSERARKTAEKLAENYWIPPFEPDKLFLERKVKVKKEITQIVLSALNEAVKEKDELIEKIQRTIYDLVHMLQGSFVVSDTLSDLAKECNKYTSIDFFEKRQKESK